MKPLITLDLVIFSKKMNENEPFDIFQLSGIGKICFGMTPQEIEEIYGAAESVGFHHLAKKLVFRSFTNLDIERVSAYQR
ncbi:hypothetical protein [Herbaspirillum rubrisubalbicans]|uniref:Uncharacterized protein n=1 Tax=Herbaspirillum rubrisubalbicans Os34 TaxID=1235827 RepID=A0A6M3ZZD2_9BURK|nr:hypothetical protein [Herbaspirillum rubrisubalbicans]QJQ02852.1 hypothetical protein C798_22250 [Herbaspirillum rubrisubalbicans Os34]